MKKQWLAILTVLCLMVTMVAPTAFAEEATDGEASTTTVRIEAESYDNSQQGTNASNKSRDNANASGGKFVDDVRLGHIFRLGENIDLTNLESITMAVGHTGSGVEYGFYIDGTKDHLGPKIATVVGTSSGDWNKYKAHTADVVVAPEFLTGEHDLYMKVEKQIPGVIYCGNVDYFELNYGSSTIVETKIEAEWASGTGRSIDEAAYAEYSNRSNPNNRPAKTYYYAEGSTSSGANTNWGDAKPEGEWASSVTALDNTFTGDAFYLGEHDLTGLTELTVRLANNQQGAVSYSFYIDGTATALGTKIATVTNIKTGSWSIFQEVTVPMMASSDVTAGKHTLFFVIEKQDQQTNGGNFDWFSFKTKATGGNSIVTSSTINFTAYSSKVGNGSKDTGNGYIGLGSTDSETLVLGFNNVSFDNLTTLAMSYAPAGAASVQIFKGAANETDGTLITEFTLNADDRVANDAWYQATNLRITHHDLGDHGLTGVDTLYFAFTKATGASHIGNLEEFTLYYEDTLSPSAKVEGENYIWGYSASESYDNWVGNTILNGTKNGDIFYLGKVDLDTLKQITLRLATANSDITANFYADMVVPDDLTRYGNRDKYKSATGLTGGTLIGSTAISRTNGDFVSNWQKYTYFNANVDTDLSGVHDVYMALTSSGTNYTGNVDYVEFVGVESVDTTTNLMGNITIVGNGKVSFPQNLEYGQTVTVSTPAAGAGYEFVGWDINGTICLESKATLPVGTKNNITAYFVEYGSALPFDNVTKVQVENYIWGVSDQTNGWNNGKTDVSGNKVSGLDNTKGDDTFYLGKMDLTDLKSITARAAKGSSGNVSYAFYADMTVDSDNWETVADRKYKPTSTVTGGTLLATVTVGNTDLNTWNNFTNFTAEATALTGEHDVYMKMMSGDTWHGYIDCVYFAYDNTASVSVSFVGKYNETITTGTATSADELMALLTNTKAPTIPGFTFLGWDDDRSAEELFETYKNDKFSITAVYEVDEDTTYAPTLGADFAAVDGKGNEVTGTTNLTFDSRVTVTAGLDKEVAYWVLDGAKVGFGQTSYTFYTSGNNNIDVVYADEVNETVTSSIVLQQSVAPYSGNAYTFSVVAQSSIVAGDSVSEYGVIYAASKEALDAVRSGETANTITVKSSKTAAGAQYITHLLQVKAGKTRVAMAYAVIGGVTVYSNQYVTVTTPADGSAVTPVIANF